MSLTLQPVRVGTGSDEEGMLVFDDDQRLVAVLMVERPGQQRVAIAHLGRPNVVVDARGIILEKRCY